MRAPPSRCRKPCYTRRVHSPSITSVQGSGPRHPAVLRVTHWITTVCFLALLVTGIEILISHPCFYWGETGSSVTTPLFRIPVPASRPTVPSGYSYVLPDQNGWSRALHFEAAWAAVLTGLAYCIWGIWTGHFRRTLLPSADQRTWPAFRGQILHHLRFRRPNDGEAHSYNSIQRLSYLVVIFVLFPMMILTGLALSPGFNSAVPEVVNWLGGRQSARTLHFFLTVALFAFLLVHVGMIFLAGFWSRVRAMITGKVQPPKEQS